MTGRAAYFLMTALERKFGVLVMIKFDLFPLLFRVTLFTFFTILTTMHIINAMAVITHL